MDKTGIQDYRIIDQTMHFVFLICGVIIFFLSICNRKHLIQIKQNDTRLARTAL